MADDLRDALQRALGDAYVIDRELAAGGMSRLFLATERSIGREVVVKVLPTELTNDVSAARFRREIEVTAHLQHPHILPVFTAGASGDLLYYVMPYVRGESLRHRLSRERQLPVPDVVRILGEAAGALAYAHQHGIVHRDIKPENILLSEGHAVLADFGIARALIESRAGDSLTATGLGIGTPGYMPPEQVAGERGIDARADIYALAVVGYEMLAGLPPFTGPSAQAVIAAHLTSDARPLRELRRDVPQSLAEALHRAMAKQPDERFQSAAEFARALAVPPTQRTSARPRWTAVGAVGVLMALAAFALLRPGAPPAVDADLLAVAPFDVIDPAPAVFHEGLVDVVSRSLDGAGALRTVSPSLVVRRWQGRADPASATALARATGAGLAVFGTVVPTGGDSVRLDATVYDVAAGGRVGEGDVRVADSRDRIDRIADSLSVRLLRVLSGARRTGTPRLGALGTQSLPALKAFLRGERFYRRGVYDSASVAYEEAITLDSSFALAYSHGADARGWSLGANDPVKAAWRLRAGRLVAGLPTRDSLRLLADSVSEAIGMRELSIDQRIALTRHGFALIGELTRRWPDDAEVWYRFGEVHLHNSTVLVGASPREILAAFERAVALDSALGPAYEHLLQLELVLRRDTARTHQYANVYLGLTGDSTAKPSARFITTILRAPRRDDAMLSQALAAIPKADRRNAFYLLGGYADREELGARLARIYVASVPPGDSTSPFMRGLVALSLAFRGHLQEADRHLGDQDIPRLRPQLLEIGLSAASPDEIIRRVLDASRVPDAREAYAYIPWLAQRHDTASLSALLAAATAQQRSSDQATVRYAEWAANATRIYSALARADTATALGILQGLPDNICVLLCDDMQLLEARLLGSRGRFATADTVLRYERLEQPEYPVAMLVRLERARVAERLQRRSEAIELYSLVADAWANGDSIVQPYVREARAGMRRAGGVSAPDRH